MLDNIKHKGYFIILRCMSQNVWYTMRLRDNIIASQLVKLQKTRRDYEPQVYKTGHENEFS